MKSLLIALPTLLFLALGFGVSPGLAQLTRPVKGGVATGPAEVELSEVTAFGRREVVAYEILPYGDDFFVSTHTSGARLASGGRPELMSLRLHRYDDQLERTGELEVAWPDEAREHISVVSLGDALLWTFTTPGRQRNTFDLRAEVLDGDGQLVSGHDLATVELRDLDGFAEFEAYSASRDYYLRVYADETDSSLFSKRDEERATVTIAVFARTGEVVSIERKRLRVTRDQLEIQSVAVDDAGRAFVLAKVYSGSKGRETRRGSDSKVYLYTLEPGDDDPERTELKLAGQYIEGISLVPGPTGAPAIVGVYTERIDGRIVGYFSTDRPADGLVLKPKPFSQELLAELGPRVTSGREGRLELEGQYEFGDALRLSDGRLTLLLESITIFQDFTRPGVGVGVGGVGFPGAGGELRYTFGEGLLLTFGSDGELDEALMVPMGQRFRLQQGFNVSRRRALDFVPPYYRMRLVEYDGKPAAIYNDNPKNFGRDLTKRTKALRFGDAMATLAFADERGRLAQQPLFARREADKVILIPGSAERLANDDVVFLATRFRTFGKNEVRFGRIRR